MLTCSTYKLVSMQRASGTRELRPGLTEDHVNFLIVPHDVRRALEYLTSRLPNIVPLVMHAISSFYTSNLALSFLELEND